MPFLLKLLNTTDTSLAIGIGTRRKFRKKLRLVMFLGRC
jgi:hypothetical protein